MIWWRPAERLQENGLKIVEAITESTGRLVINRASYQLKSEAVATLVNGDCPERNPMSLLQVIHQSNRALLDDLFKRLASRAVALDADLMKLVTSIIDDVRERGDEALIDYTTKFDGVQLKPSELRISEEALRRSAVGVDTRVMKALREAIANVRAFHEREAEKSWEFSPAAGISWASGALGE